MPRLWILLERTVILQGVVILMFIVGFCAHAAVGHKMVTPLGWVLALSLGLWLGMLSQFNRERGEGG